MQDKPLESPPTDPAAPLPAASTPANLPLPNAPPVEPQPDGPTEEPASPAWASDLRNLYNAVVEEPLPDSLIDLLSQLDAED